MIKPETGRSLTFRQRRRSAILEAARNLCRDHGYEAMTMEQVAVHADVTKPTLYAYFSSKEELVVEAFIESVDVRLQLVEEMSATLSPLERFRRILRYSLTEKISSERIVLSWPGPPISTNLRFAARFHGLPRLARGISARRRLQRPFTRF